MLKVTVTTDFAASKHRRTRTGFIALVLLLVWSQIANAHHLVEHANNLGAEFELCELAHSPLAGTNSVLSYTLPNFNHSGAVSNYLSPFVGKLDHQLADIRGPPSLLR